MGTGLDLTFGVALEDTYGTYEAPTDFLEIDSSSLKREDNWLTSTALRRRPGRPVARRRKTTRQGTGTIGLKVPNKGFGQILNLLHGETVAPVQQGATPAYLQQHAIGETPPNGKSLTIQENKPTVEDDDNAFTYLGCKFTQAVFACETSQELTCSLETLAAEAVTNEALAVPSYPDPISSRDFTEASILIDGDDATQIIGGFTLTIPLPLKTGRWGLGRGGVQAEPIGFNDYMTPTLALPAEFTNTEMYDFYIAGAAVPIVIEFVGPVISGVHRERIKFTMAECSFVDGDPEVEGPDVLDQSPSIEIYDNGSDPLVAVDYVSVDTAL